MIAVRPNHDEMEVLRLAAKPKTEATAAAAAAYSTDDDSAGSSEEMESPRSVQGRWRRFSSSSYSSEEKKTKTKTKTAAAAKVHSQILRIRKEESNLGQSCFGAKDKAVHAVDVVVLARSVLPSSPLKNTVNACH